MIKSVSDISLKFITSLNSNIKTCQELSSILGNITNPGDFLEKLPEFKTAVNRVDTCISKDKNNIQYLISEYRQRLEEAKATISEYITRAENRILSPDQMNSNVTFFDEENQLSKSCYRGFDENPANYSMLAIMKRIMNDEEDNLSCLEKVLDTTNSIYQSYVNSQSALLRIRNRINDNEFTQLFTSDYMSANTESEISQLQRFFNMICIDCTDAKKKIEDIFQMFLAQDKDYKIYATAIERFEQKVLESYFSVGAVTSGVL